MPLANRLGNVTNTMKTTLHGRDGDVGPLSCERFSGTTADDEFVARRIKIRVRRSLSREEGQPLGDLMT